MYKEMIYHSGYVGGLKRVPFKEMVFTKPEVLFRQCVYRMLPKNRKRFPRLRKLFIYRDQEHKFPFLPKVEFTKISLLRSRRQTRRSTCQSSSCQKRN